MNSVHTGVKNFPCPECGKKFKSNYDLNRHRDTVHLGNKPCCPFCGKHLANIRQHIRVVHNIGGDPVIASRTGNPNIEPSAGGMYNHTNLQKELSDEQLIAQYLGKQHFTLPDSEQNELVIKPDLDHLINTQRPEHHIHLKPEPNHDPQGLTSDQLSRGQDRGEHSVSRDQLGIRLEQSIARDHHLIRGGEQLVLRNDQVLQRDELGRHHQHLPQQNQGAAMLTRTSNYNSSLDKYNSIDKYNTGDNHIISANHQFWAQGASLATAVPVQQSAAGVQAHSVKLKQTL